MSVLSHSRRPNVYEAYITPTLSHMMKNIGFTPHKRRHAIATTPQLTYLLKSVHMG